MNNIDTRAPCTNIPLADSKRTGKTSEKRTTYEHTFDLLEDPQCFGCCDLDFSVIIGKLMEKGKFMDV